MSGNTEDIKPVKCTIKPPFYLQIGDTKTDPAHSGVCVVDVTLPFGKPVNVRDRNLCQLTCILHDFHALFSSTLLLSQSKHTEQS